MRICKQISALIVMLLFSCNIVLAGDNTSGYADYFTSGECSSLVTTIHYDDSTGAVTGTSTLQAYTGQEDNNIFENLTVSDERLQDTDSMPQNEMSFYNGRSFLNNNSSIVRLNVSGPNNFASAREAYYKKVQNALSTMPVAALSGGYMNQLQSYDEAFHNTDLHMMFPKKERLASRYANIYAVAEYEGLENFTAYPSAYSPTIIYSDVKRFGDKNGIWMRPYVSTGSTNFKNGSNVDNTMYGVYIGGDSSIKHLKHSDFQYSLYAAYTGSHQSFNKNKIDQNGGLGGITGSWYGENAFAAITVNAGASNADLKTEFMKKNYPMFTAGVSVKTGYNWEFSDGKFIIQPNYMMSYSFISPFEKDKISGLSIDSKPLNILNISPGVKFIGNFESGWQPYLEASFVWSLFDKTNYSTAQVDIPSISVKPYAQYGIGIQKLWGERSTGFIQFMMRSGGRNDISFNAGYRCALGD